MSDTSAASVRPPQTQPVGSFRNALTLFRVEGVPVRLDISWLIIAGLVTWLFHQRLALALAGSGDAVVLGAALAAALLFFLSLLAHELGHALTSLDRGIPVVGITLFLLGGVTESTREADRARDEFVIVGIGPFTSLVLAALFGLIHTGTQGMAAVAAVTGYLAWTNLLLAVFNVVPAYPLDGGRLLRSVLWAVSGRRHGATRWAARVGQVFALALAGYGVWSLAGGYLGGLGGLWEIILGFFLFRGAADAHRRARVQERLARRTAAEVMGAVPPRLDSRIPVAVAAGYVRERPSLLWPVSGPAGYGVAGLVGLRELDRVPARESDHVTVGEVAIPADGHVVEASTPLDEAVRALADAPQRMLVVVEGGEPVGLLTPSLVGDLGDD